MAVPENLRNNLLTVLQKTLKLVQKRVYLHRIIYIASYVQDRNNDQIQDSRVFNITVDTNIKLINEDYCEDFLTGFGLFYTGYFINIVERYYTTWNGRTATPPVLLEKIEQTISDETKFRHIQNCIMKLYRMSEYLRNQTTNHFKIALDNISELCRSNLPEFNLLDFLLDCPVLVDLKEYIEMYGSVPDYTSYSESIWPLSSDFVPRNILSDTKPKTLITADNDNFKESEELEIFTEEEEIEDKEDKEEKDEKDDINKRYEDVMEKL
ncbi:hypothetical protein Phum_PHUM280640 [Pediculus humanus corporis]|uniref:Uncharacterized protein n=1 Tax=Pediculus humanus subsp. corporis TaxID=121224 RepID=E0VL40_PEDHC|nr:uncharacterized protein Phum_PHUM280640 [Pediculus humanus corporis]EEB14096.1 hypothetical protein Phum_PHUM280640 [Pediculus humanus corporis]